MEAPEAKKPGDDLAVHPFVNAFANIGAMMGRDLGVVALRSIESQKGNVGAILVWAAGNIPETVLAKVPQEMQSGIYAVMLIPTGAVVPAFNFVDVEVQALSANVIDGSKLVVFVQAPVKDTQAPANAD